MNAPARRLLAINNYFYRRGGAEAVFFDHMEMFRRLDWDVVPFAMQHGRNEPSPWSAYFVSEIEFGEPASLARRVGQAASVIYSFEARRRLKALIDSLGFAAVDAGGLKNARYLEAVAGFNIYLGYGAGKGTSIAPFWIERAA